VRRAYCEDESGQPPRRLLASGHAYRTAGSSPAAINARVAGKRVTFSTGTRPDESQFEGLPLNSKQIEDHRVRLLTNEPEQVLRELFRRGVEIQNLEVAGADLEEAFVAMTHQQTQT